MDKMKLDYKDQDAVEAEAIYLSHKGCDAGLQYNLFTQKPDHVHVTQPTPAVQEIVDRKIKVKCTGGAMYGTQCVNDAKWINQNGVVVCDYHKLVLDTFTWDSRNERKREAIS